MSECSTLPFSVAKFAIEGHGEGMTSTQLVQPIPPRLSVSRTLFLADSCSLLNRFHVSNVHAPDCLTSRRLPQDICTSTQPASSSLSLFPKVISPFVDAFSIPSQNSISISSSNVVSNILNDASTLHTSNIVQKPLAQSSSSLLAPSLPIPPLPLSMHTSIETARRLSSSSSTAVDTPLATRKPRKVPADRTITNSPYRPRVSAADRIFSWRTPYGISHDLSLLAELPPALAESAKMSITGALAASTRSTYASGILRFNQFCDKWNIAEGSRMPASYGLLCAFIGEHKGTISGRTIRSWLSGIRAWHLANHAQWHGDDKWVQMARTSANKEGAHHRRPLRAPVSIEHLLALRRVLSLSDSFHASVWAAALITFFGCRRLGETTISSPSSFDGRYHVLRSTMYAHSLQLVLLSYTDDLSLVLLSTPSVTVLAPFRSVFPGQKPPAKKAPL